MGLNSCIYRALCAGLRYALTSKRYYRFKRSSAEDVNGSCPVEAEYRPGFYGNDSYYAILHEDKEIDRVSLVDACFRLVKSSNPFRIPDQMKDPRKYELLVARMWYDANRNKFLELTGGLPVTDDDAIDQAVAWVDSRFEKKSSKESSTADLMYQWLSGKVCYHTDPHLMINGSAVYAFGIPVLYRTSRGLMVANNVGESGAVGEAVASLKSALKRCGCQQTSQLTVDGWVVWSVPRVLKRAQQQQQAPTVNQPQTPQQADQMLDTWYNPQPLETPPPISLDSDTEDLKSELFGSGGQAPNDTLQNIIVNMYDLVSQMSRQVWGIELPRQDGMRIVKDVIKRTSEQIADIPVQATLDVMDAFLKRQESEGKGGEEESPPAYGQPPAGEVPQQSPGTQAPASQATPQQQGTQGTQAPQQNSPIPPPPIPGGGSEITQIPL